MARAYETKDEQANRELRAYYAGVDPEPAGFPPKIVKTRPRYQTIDVMVRRNVNAFKQQLKAYKRLTKQPY